MSVKVCSPDQICERRQMVRKQAQRARDELGKLDPDGMKSLYHLKFDDRGYHPLEHQRWNFIEQLNQTFHSMAVLSAAEKLLQRHPNCEGLYLELTTGQGIDVRSIPQNMVHAEVFAAKTPTHNGRLRDNVNRLSTSTACNRYVFFFCPGYSKGRKCELEQRYNNNGIQIWALDPAEVM